MSESYECVLSLCSTSQGFGTPKAWDVLNLDYIYNIYHQNIHTDFPETYISSVLCHINGLVQERRNSIANAQKLRLSCTKPSICLNCVDINAPLIFRMVRCFIALYVAFIWNMSTIIPVIIVHYACCWCHSWCSHVACVYCGACQQGGASYHHGSMIAGCIITFWW